MGVAKLVPRTDVLVVTTPALAAQLVASRAVSMAHKNFLRVAGVIENMSAFVCDHGTSYPLFGTGGGEALAKEAGAPLLGQIPLEPAVALGGDTGDPVSLGEGPAAEAFRAIADVLVNDAIPAVDYAGCSSRMLAAAEAALAALDEPVPADDDAVVDPFELADGETTSGAVDAGIEAEDVDQRPPDEPVG
jgi:ATP-binding protein involved in chromosome partitioning